MIIKTALIAMAIIATGQVHADELSDLVNTLSSDEADQFSELQAEMEEKQEASTAQKTDATCPYYMCLYDPSLFFSDDECKGALEKRRERIVWNAAHPWKKPKKLMEPYHACMDVSSPSDPNTQKISTAEYKLIPIPDDDPRYDQGFLLEEGECKDRFAGQVVKKFDCIGNVEVHTLFLQGVQLGDYVVMGLGKISGLAWTMDPVTEVFTRIEGSGEN